MPTDQVGGVNEFTNSLSGEIGSAAAAAMKLSDRYVNAVNSLLVFGDIQKVNQAPTIQEVIGDLGDWITLAQRCRVNMDVVLATKGGSLESSIFAINEHIRQPDLLLKHHPKTKAMGACYVDQVKYSPAYKMKAGENGMWLVESEINPAVLPWDDPNLSLQERCDKFFNHEIGIGETYWQAIHHAKIGLMRGWPIDYGSLGQQTTFTVLPGELESFPGSTPYINWHERSARIDLMLNQLKDRRKTNARFRRVFGAVMQWAA